MTYGTGANKFSADQGYSEHQLATAFDFTTPEIHDMIIGYDKTAAYTWMTANAYKYGFILSYPPHNSYYVYEPWHWRFVGIALATYLHNSNQYFYQLDQRTINTYLVSIFDQ
jgi:D-alanyl-D-alanine carboxypeptidase